jgi:DNA-binding NarL/FixJ family response regulator
MDQNETSRRLTNSHQEILFLISKGLRNAEIASHLGLAERTIKGYVSQLLLIFDVTNRTELVGLFADGPFEKTNQALTSRNERRIPKQV